MDICKRLNGEFLACVDADYVHSHVDGNKLSTIYIDKMKVTSKGNPGTRIMLCAKHQKCVYCGLKVRYYLLTKHDYGNSSLVLHPVGIRKSDGVHVPITSDHVIPKSKGGSNDQRNLVPLCEPCNMLKANRMPKIKVVYSLTLLKNFMLMFVDEGDEVREEYLEKHRKTLQHKYLNGVMKDPGVVETIEEYFDEYKELLGPERISKIKKKARKARLKVPKMEGELVW